MIIDIDQPKPFYKIGHYFIVRMDTPCLYIVERVKISAHQYDIRYSSHKNYFRLLKK